MSDKIEEIRERYAGYSLNSGNAGTANEDRGWLLAEVDRLRAENDRLTSHVALVAERARQLSDERDYAWGEVEKQRAEIERLRAALGGIRIDGPDADGLVWAIIQHPDIAARSRVAVYPVGKTIRYLCSNLPDGRILMEPEVEECAPELERLRAALEYMVNVCPAIDPDGDRAHEQARKALEGKP